MIEGTREGAFYFATMICPYHFLERISAMTITTKTYTDFNAAFDHFNKELFDGVLPQPLLTLVPHKNAYGYMRHEAFHLGTKQGAKRVLKKATEKTDNVIHEVALNPFTFTGRTPEQIMGTLVHEMVHLWQMVHGANKPKKPTHNREWADKMKSVGLHPSSTGTPGGRETGRRVTHYIIEGGPFTKAAKRCNIKFDFAGLLIQKEKKGSKRTKYTCPGCEKNAYGTDDLNLTCTDCEVPFERN
jgi:predicted SprT family Zn-dependent metalloprotease